jgi:hypothetical protein
MYEQKPPQSILDYWRQRGRNTARDGVKLVVKALAETEWRA